MAYSQFEIPFFGAIIARPATAEERRMVFNPRKVRTGEISPNTSAVEIGGKTYAVSLTAQSDMLQTALAIAKCKGQDGSDVQTPPLYPGDIRAAWKVECEKYNAQTAADPLIPCRTLCSGNEGDFQVTEYRLPSGEGLVSWGSFRGHFSGFCVCAKYGTIQARIANPCANL